MTRVPARIDKYEILRRLGSGGMGTVYLGRDSSLGREVAIKVLRGPVFDTDDELLARFLQEARATAKLRHSNIVTVYEVGQHDQQPFIVMEFVPGDSLARLIQERRALPLATKLHYLEQICAGLHFAHRAGIVHRDIKPANIMVDPEGMVRILDFGIARLEDSRMTRDGDMMGTVNYMSPEQMLGRRVDHRSDIFAVGTVAYELIAYRQAFPGTMQDGLLQRLPHEPHVPLSSLCPEADAELEASIDCALEKAPESRQPNLAHLQAAIAACRRRLLQQHGAAYEVVPAPPEGGFAPTLHRARPRTDAEEIRSDLEEAERRLQAGDPTSAVDLAERVIRKAPSSVEAHALLLRAHGALAGARSNSGPAEASPHGRRRAWAFPAAAAGLLAAAATAAGLAGVFDREAPRVETPAVSAPDPSATPTREDVKEPDGAGVEAREEPATVPEPPKVAIEPQIKRPRDVPSADNGPGDAAGTAAPAAPAPSNPAPAEPVVVPAETIPVETSTPVPIEPPPAPAPVVSVLDRERPAILLALENYRNAYRNRSVAAMQEVFPTLPRERRQAYEKAFKDGRTCPALDVRFGDADIFLGSGGEQANVTVMATYVCKPATAQDNPQAPQADVFQMRKSGDRWQITAMGEIK